MVPSSRILRGEFDHDDSIRIRVTRNPRQAQHHDILIKSDGADTDRYVGRIPLSRGLLERVKV